jgi:hypothetical protein
LVENSDQFVSHKTRELIDRLLLEYLSLAGIAHTTQVSLRWLQDYINHKLESEPADSAVSPKKKTLTTEMNELWSFLDCNTEFRL